MKKLMLMIAFMAVTFSASAQVYIGGGIGFNSYKPYHHEKADVDTKTTINLVPEIGYKLDDNMSIGLMLGYGHSKEGDLKNDVFAIEPYIRYTFVKWNKVSLFGEASFGYAHLKETKTYNDEDTGKEYSESEKASEWGIGVRPGIAIDLTDKLTLLTRVGYLGYTSYKPDGDNIKASSEFDFNLNGENLKFSLIYNF
ncbi:porin family protein [Xylanibacter muris]|uniref:Porin family protein n=1 Tax=Xylanibacter muris TaxID=2736290 RepID=A0ABX2AKD4_9BACT|nr:porin family protein [Xylanibacter muris]NPD91333.1 porin family protein [Xylanibacter muris]